MAGHCACLKMNRFSWGREDRAELSLICFFIHLPHNSGRYLIELTTDLMAEEGSLSFLSEIFKNFVVISLFSFINYLKLFLGVTSKDY